MNTKEQQTMLDSKVPRITGLLVIEVRDSNPNGDPDNAGFPRQRPDDRGEISPVSIKRKMRDLVERNDGDSLVWSQMKERLNLGADANDRFLILEGRGRKREEITKLLENDFAKFKAMYWDARLFGNTFLEKDGKDTIRAGVAHFGVGVSVAPVRIRFETWTNKSGVQEGKDRGFAPQALKYVEHGVYAMPFFVNPTQARKTGCTGEDVRLMLHLLKHAYRDNPSTGRTQVELVHAHAVEHRDQLGSFSDFALLDTLKPVRKGDDPEKPSTSREDYHIPTWADINTKPVRKQGDKVLTWDDVGIHTDYALL
jgi:CRISPR-associated protein Csd2